MESKVFVCIGSNIGNGVKNCLAAIKSISSDKRVDLISISSFYNTSPVSDIKQNDFINCTVLIRWDGTAYELLSFLQQIENSMGRKREEINGPRIIDLDILLFGNMIINEPSLTIPHKELHRRKFALIPCIEIDPAVIIPTFNRPLNELLASINTDQIVTKLNGIEYLNESSSPLTLYDS